MGYIVLLPDRDKFGVCFSEAFLDLIDFNFFSFGFFQEFFKLSDFLVRVRTDDAAYMWSDSEDLVLVSDMYLICIRLILKS